MSAHQQNCPTDNDHGSCLRLITVERKRGLPRPWPLRNPTVLIAVLRFAVIMFLAGTVAFSVAHGASMQEQYESWSNLSDRAERRSRNWGPLSNGENMPRLWFVFMAIAVLLTLGSIALLLFDSDSTIARYSVGMALSVLVLCTWQPVPE